eukprot:TRINITY_DN66390_c0_g1_i6.p1 TRINITY_DN66390_c0_g1~~TRINITY_DN66390_c0_g1_i6.p1  ORF type:complete len:174 (-),score=31.91 TRINITY_DN66390_c0_g1_i6:424-945(-)
MVITGPTPTTTGITSTRTVLKSRVDIRSGLHTLFKFFDTVSNSGYVETSQLKKFFGRFGLSNLQWAELSSVDRLSLEQFCRLFNGLSIEPAVSEEVKVGLRMLWLWADVDGSGQLDGNKRLRFMMRLGLNQITWTDKDKNGAMSFDEFWSNSSDHSSASCGHHRNTNCVGWIS